MLNKKEPSDRSSDKEKTSHHIVNETLAYHNKTKNHNFARNWKPYKFLNKYEKKKLQDREAHKDHDKQV